MEQGSGIHLEFVCILLGLSDSTVCGEAPWKQKFSYADFFLQQVLFSKLYPECSFAVNSMYSSERGLGNIA